MPIKISELKEQHPGVITDISELDFGETYYMTSFPSHHGGDSRRSISTVQFMGIQLVDGAVGTYALTLKRKDQNFDTLAYYLSIDMNGTGEVGGAQMLFHNLNDAVGGEQPQPQNAPSFTETFGDLRDFVFTSGRNELGEDEIDDAMDFHNPSNDDYGYNTTEADDLDEDVDDADYGESISVYLIGDTDDVLYQLNKIVEEKVFGSVMTAPEEFEIFMKLAIGIGTSAELLLDQLVVIAQNIGMRVIINGEEQQWLIGY